MKILSIEAKDFLSFADMFYEFIPGSVLIQGVNKTDINQVSNGSGKTSFQAVIEFCLYGNTSAKLKDKELIRHGRREAMVSMKLYCPIREEYFVITRGIKKTGRNTIELLINDEPVRIATILDGNNYVNQWIGITREDLQNYYVIHKSRYKSFFNSSNTEKVQLIGRFSKADIVSEVIPIMVEKNAKLEKELTEKHIAYSRCEGKIEALIIKVDSHTEDEFNRNKEDRLNNIDRTIDQYQISIFKNGNFIKNTSRKIEMFKSNIAELHNKIKESEWSVSQIEKVDYETLTRRKKEQIDLIDELKHSRILINDQIFEKTLTFDDVKQMLNRVNKNLMSVVICPKCQHEFSPGDEPGTKNIENNKKKKVRYEDTINSLKKKLIELREKIDTIDLKIKAAYEKQDKIDKKVGSVTHTLDKLRRSITESEYKIEETQHTINLEQAALDDAVLKNEKNNQLIDDLQKQKKEIKRLKYNTDAKDRIEKELKNEKANVNSLDKKINELESQIAHVKKWGVLFKEFRNFLAHQFLQVIEGLCNSFLEDLKSDIQIKWEGYKIKTDGTLSDRITPYVMRRGEVREFNSFSSGEQARMEFALILTIRALINKAHPYGGLDFLFADEKFEGLDGLGLSNLMSAINVLNYPVLITTHVSDMNLCSRMLMIVKENGISKIEKQYHNRD